METSSSIPDLFNSIPSGSKSDILIKRITDSLISGVLKPGDKIPTEKEFCEKLGVGRNTIREAIKVLVAFGVLEIRRSEGTYVVDKFTQSLLDPVLYGLILCPKSLNDLLEFKISMWTSVISLAIDKATEVDIVQLRLLYEHLEHSLKSENPNLDAIFNSSEKFHQYIGKATYNPMLEQINELVVKFSTNTRRESIQLHIKNNTLNVMLSDYYNMLSLIEERDKDNLIRVLDKLLINWKAHLA